MARQIKYLLLVFSILNLGILKADTTDYFADNYLRYSDFIYKKNIQTVLLHDYSVVIPDANILVNAPSFQQSTLAFTVPVLQLNSDKQLKLSFDDFDLSVKNYNYTLIHCDAFWNPSSLMQNEYLDGFFENNIYDYKYSLNTVQRYIHYNAVFPSSNVKITKSGNYLLKVYENSDPENLIITKRFMVLDEKVTVAALVQAATNVNERYLKQEVDLKIFSPKYELTNPYKDVKVVITQNDRWDNAVSNLKPLFVKDKELVYDYDVDNVFSGGNEFRSFDCRNVRYQNMNVKQMVSDSTGFHMYLLDDTRRSAQKYSYNQDINGKFLIKSQQGNNSEIESEYVYVHFFIPMYNPTTDGNLYVFGGLTNWQCNASNRMTYNYKKFGYEATLYVKQGYYDYKYVLAKDGDKALDEGFIEGEHFETENDYTVYVYHQAQIGVTYDQLISVTRTKSFR